MKLDEPLPLAHLSALPELAGPDKNAFVAAQYQEVRREVMDRLKELWALEKFALLGAAGLAAWLLTHADDLDASYRLAWWLPFVFLFACLLRFVAGMRHLTERTTKFLVQIERRYLGSGGGWEQWFSKQSPNETYAFFGVWGFALLAALALPFMKLCLGM
jgi:hypothetical protein